MTLIDPELHGDVTIAIAVVHSGSRTYYLGRVRSHEAIRRCDPRRDLITRRDDGPIVVTLNGRVAS